MIGRTLVVLAAALGLQAAPAFAAAPSAPRPQAPAAGATVQTLGAFTWAKARGASVYELELSADRAFGSLIGGRPVKTGNTAYVPDKPVADGLYFWRVRGLTPKGRAGRWSAVRELRKQWSDRPELTAAIGGLPLLQPAQPVVLRWTAVPHAAEYRVFVATDPSLATSVVSDGGGRGIETSATSLAPPAALAPGTYYWAVVPLDGDGHPGTSSAVGSFVSAWPATTAGKVTDLNADARVFDPELSWDAVPGAVGYDVEVNYSQDFAIGSKVCCSEKSIGTTVSPTTLLANNTYYWRVRAIDAGGNAGQWNGGPEFKKVFDDVVPTVPGLAMRDNLSETPTDLDGSTPELDLEHPVVRWDPVPGASSYEVQVTEHTTGCDWTKRIVDAQMSGHTAATSWTMRAFPSVKQPGQDAWPSALVETHRFVDNARYCVRVSAIAGADEKSKLVVSEWTQIEGANQPAFTYRKPVTAPDGMPVMTADHYETPTSGTLTPRTPLLSWKRHLHADSYWVVIARDASFTNVKEVGFTRIAAYAPRNTLEDETTSYYWVVFPANHIDGSGVFSTYSDNAPRNFEKRSIPPAQSAPEDKTDIIGSPRFAWTAAEGAIEYRLQVATDPSFGSLVEDVTTAATSYTPTKTYPVDTVLYWRVRANAGRAEAKVGLGWSQVRTMRRRLPTPELAGDNAQGGNAIPALSWNPVQGAESYEVQVEQADGGRQTLRVASTVLTPTKFYGNGIWRWQVRAMFPGSPTTAGPYSAMLPFVRAIPAPADAKAQRSRDRVLLSWSPVQGARRYKVEVAPVTGFTNTVDSFTTDHTGFAPDLSAPAYQKGGRLYWRVAAIDEGGNAGAFASGVITLERRLALTVQGQPHKRVSAMITVRVADGGNTEVRGAKVTVTGAGVRIVRRTPANGSLALQIRPRRKGTLVFKATRKGYTTATRKLRVR